MLPAILIGYGLALLAPFFVRVTKNAAGALLAAVPAFLFAFFLQFVPEAAEGKPWRFVFPWGGPGGIEAAFWLDSLALYFALTITALSAAALLATAGLALSDSARARLIFALLSLMSSALGFVLADTPVLVMSFAVLASLSVFLALTAKAGAPDRAARIPVLVALMAGDLILIGALAALVIGSGAASLSDLTSRPVTGTFAGSVETTLLLIAGCFRFAILPAAGRMMEPAALLAHGAAYLPLTLYMALRFAPVLGVQFDALVLGAFGALLLVVGGIAGLYAMRLRALLASVTALLMGLVLVHLATLWAGSITVAMLIVLAHALGLGAILLAAQMIPVGSGALDLAQLSGRARAQPLVFILMTTGVLAFVGLIPSLGLLALTKSLNQGLAQAPNYALVALTATGHAFAIAILGRIVRSLIRRPGETAARPAALNAAPLAGSFALLALLLALGWNPDIIGRLFVDPMIARLAPITSLAPFWPQGLAIALAAGVFGFAALLLWFETPIQQSIAWAVRAMPRRPARAWRGMLGVLNRGSAGGLRGLDRLGQGGIAPAITVLLIGAFIWLAVIAARGPAPSLGTMILPAAALAAIAALAALMAVFQRECEHALPLLSISSALAALTILAAGSIDLAYLMVLVLVLETMILLLIGPRILSAPRRKPSWAGRGARAVLAITAGAGASIAAIVAPNGVAQMSWLRLDQFHLSAAVVALLLVLGIIVTDLNRRRMSGAV